MNPDHGISEDLVDMIKLGLATAPPASTFVFGVSLDNWMFIMSIVASIFYIMDKMPVFIKGAYAWYKAKYSGGSGRISPPPDAS